MYSLFAKELANRPAKTKTAPTNVAFPIPYFLDILILSGLRPKVKPYGIDPMQPLKFSLQL